MQLIEHFTTLPPSGGFFIEKLYCSRNNLKIDITT